MDDENVISGLMNIDKFRSDPTELCHFMTLLQRNINRKFLEKQSSGGDKFFASLWNFLLHAGLHSNTSVRLAAYRTAGVFLLKATPYFPKQIQRTFSDMATTSTLTLDMKSSAIIASAFAFVSNFNALPYLDAFVHQNPVFHHFSNGDPIFSDHLASIIRNLGRLGIEWMTGLLHSFLQQLGYSSDRYLILSIAAVVKHAPLPLMNELLVFIREQSHVRKHLALISFLCTSIDCNFDSLDFLDIAEASMNVLENADTATTADVDSAFQILGLYSPSFSLVIEKISDSSLRLVLQNGQGEKRTEMVLNVSAFLNRPSFYLLMLPLEFLIPEAKDGVLHLTSKFKTMARMMNHSVAGEVLLDQIVAQFSSFLSRKYDDRTSACMQGLASCLPTLLRNYIHRQTVLHLISLCVFVPCQSWYHATDIVRVVKAIPVEFLKKEMKVERVLTKLLEFITNKNEKLQAAAKKCIVKMVVNTDFYRYTHMIAGMIDYHDTKSMVAYLDVLSMVLSNSSSKSRSTVHLHYVVLAVLEVLPFCDLDLTVLKTAMIFLSCFDLGFVETQTLYSCFLLATTVISASVLLLTGEHWDNGMKLSMEDDLTEMIRDDMASMNYDIISETRMDYTQFLSPFAAALKLMSALPCQMLGPDFVRSVFGVTMNVFPLDSAKLVHKHWDTFNDREKVAILRDVFPTLRYVQGYEPAAIWCALVMTLTKKRLLQELSGCRDVLHEIARWAIGHGEFVHVFFAYELLECMDIVDIKRDIAALTEGQREELKDYMDKFFPGLWGRLNHEIDSMSSMPSSSSAELLESDSPRDFSIDDEPTRSPRNDSQRDSSAVDFGPEPIVTEDEKGKESSCGPSGSVTPNDEGESDQNKKPRTRRVLYRKQRFASTPEITIQTFDQNCQQGLATFVTSVSDEEMTSTALKQSLIDDYTNPIIKTQLRYRTFTFAPDDLQKLLSHYAERGDSGGIISVLIYCLSKRIRVSVSGLVLPTDTLPQVIRYLKLVASPEMSTFLETVVNIENDTKVEMAVRCADSGQYLAQLLKLEKIKKREIMALCRAIPQMRLDENQLISLTNNLINVPDDATKHRLSLIVALVTVIIQCFSRLPPEFASALLSTFKEWTERVYDISLARWIAVFTAKTGLTDELKLFVNTCMSRIAIGSSLYLLYRQTLILRSSSFVAGDSPTLLVSYFESIYPSVFASGCRYLYHAISTVQDQQVVLFLKHNLKSLMANYHQFSQLPGLSDSVGLLLAYILSSTTRELFRRYQRSIIKHCQELVPTRNDVSFASFVACLPRLIALISDQEDQLKYLCEIGDDLLTAPLSYFLFRTYLMTLRERAGKARTPAEKENYLMDNLGIWLKKAEICDCYRLPDVIFDWEMLIYQNLGLDYLISVAWLQMHKLIKRFFPFFIALNRFIKKEAPSLGPDDKTSIDVRLGDFALMDRTRAHSLALLLCRSGQYSTEMLDLAMFDCDCPESEAIISSNPAFEDMLSSIQ